MAADHLRPETLLRRQRACGYSEEDLRVLLGPMGSKGEEPIGSMGTDVPLACLFENHLRSVFRKLDIGSRTQIARALTVASP